MHLQHQKRKEREKNNKSQKCTLKSVRANKGDNHNLAGKDLTESKNNQVRIQHLGIKK